MCDTRDFRELLAAQWAQGKFVCVGLDTDFDKIPDTLHYRAVNDYDVIHKTILHYNCAIVDATRDIVGFYKPNIAFYEGYGQSALQALGDTIEYINNVAPAVPVILDAKRADIGSTNEGYARAAFGIYGADAITVNPYFGHEALEPFLRWDKKGVFVLCRTSNPGASVFQDSIVMRPGTPAQSLLYQLIAQQVAKHWNGSSNCGVVVGATYPEELQIVRTIVGDMPILIPGIGAQGGDLEKTIAAGKNSRGQGMIINSSRGIIFAKQQEDESYADAARRETLTLHQSITKCLSSKE